MDENKINLEFERLKSEINGKKFHRISRLSRIGSLFILSALFIVTFLVTVKYNSLLTDVRNLEEKRDELKKECNALLDQKNELQKELTNSDAVKDILGQQKPDKKIIVRYFSKTADENRIASELNTLGYRFETKAPSGQMKSETANAIWFGQGVNIEDVKIVALTLLRAGVPVKGIRPFEKTTRHSMYKKGIIEVGAAADLNDKPVLTVSQVKEARTFKR